MKSEQEEEEEDEDEKQPLRVAESMNLLCSFRCVLCLFSRTTNFTHSLQQHSLNYLQSLSLRCCFCYQSAAAAILLHLPLLWRQKTKFIKANREKANTNNNNSSDSNSEKRQKNETTNSSDLYTSTLRTLTCARTNVDGILATQSKTFALLSNPIDSFNHIKRQWDDDDDVANTRGASPSTPFCFCHLLKKFYYMIRISVY